MTAPSTCLECPHLYTSEDCGSHCDHPTVADKGYVVRPAEEVPSWCPLREPIATMAAYDCRHLVDANHGNVRVVRRLVGFFEKRCAEDRGLTGRARGRYQRAFHRALKGYAEVGS